MGARQGRLRCESLRTTRSPGRTCCLELCDLATAMGQPRQKSSRATARQIWLGRQGLQLTSPTCRAGTGGPQREDGSDGLEVVVDGGKPEE